MRTIRPPKHKPVYHLTCSNLECDAIMECELHELRRSYDQRDGDAYAMKCPHCKRESWFMDIHKYARAKVEPK